MMCWRCGRLLPVDKPGDHAAKQQIVKTMSLSAHEFRRSLAFFAPETAGSGEQNLYHLGTEHKGLSIALEEMEPFRPGGLIVLPRCRITLTFTGYTADQRAAMLARFDRIYFRGGG